MKDEIKLILEELKNIEKAENTEALTQDKIAEICEKHCTTFEELRDSVLRILADETGISLDELESLSLKEISEEDLMNVSGGTSTMQRITAASLAALLGCNTFANPHATTTISQGHSAASPIINQSRQSELEEQDEDDYDLDNNGYDINKIGIDYGLDDDEYKNDKSSHEQDEDLDASSKDNKQKLKWLAGLGGAAVVAAILGLSLKHYRQSPGNQKGNNAATSESFPEFRRARKEYATQLFNQLTAPGAPKCTFWMTNDCFNAYNSLANAKVYIIANATSNNGTLTDVLLHIDAKANTRTPEAIKGLKPTRVLANLNQSDASSRWLVNKLKESYAPPKEITPPHTPTTSDPRMLETPDHSEIPGAPEPETKSEAKSEIPEIETNPDEVPVDTSSLDKCYMPQDDCATSTASSPNPFDTAAKPFGPPLPASSSEASPAFERLHKDNAGRLFYQLKKTDAPKCTFWVADGFLAEYNKHDDNYSDVYIIASAKDKDKGTLTDVLLYAGTQLPDKNKDITAQINDLHPKKSDAISLTSEDASSKWLVSKLEQRYKNTRYAPKPKQNKNSSSNPFDTAAKPFGPPLPAASSEALPAFTCVKHKEAKKIFNKLTGPNAPKCTFWATQEFLTAYNNHDDELFNVYIIACAPDSDNPTDILLHTDKPTEEGLHPKKSDTISLTSEDASSKWFKSALIRRYGPRHPSPKGPDQQNPGTTIKPGMPAVSSAAAAAPAGKPATASRTVIRGNDHPYATEPANLGYATWTTNHIITYLRKGHGSDLELDKTQFDVTSTNYKLIVAPMGTARAYNGHNVFRYSNAKGESPEAYYATPESFDEANENQKSLNPNISAYIDYIPKIVESEPTKDLRINPSEFFKEEYYAALPNHVKSANPVLQNRIFNNPVLTAASKNGQFIPFHLEFQFYTELEDEQGRPYYHINGSPSQCDHLESTTTKQVVPVTQYINDPTAGPSYASLAIPAVLQREQQVLNGTISNMYDTVKSQIPQHLLPQEINGVRTFLNGYINLELAIDERGNVFKHTFAEEITKHPPKHYSQVAVSNDCKHVFGYVFLSALSCQASDYDFGDDFSNKFNQFIEHGVKDQREVTNAFLFYLWLYYQLENFLVSSINIARSNTAKHIVMHAPCIGEGAFNNYKGLNALMWKILIHKYAKQLCSQDNLTLRLYTHMGPGPGTDEQFNQDMFGEASNENTKDNITARNAVRVMLDYVMNGYGNFVKQNESNPLKDLCDYYKDNTEFKDAKVHDKFKIYKHSYVRGVLDYGLSAPQPQQINNNVGDGNLVQQQNTLQAQYLSNLQQLKGQYQQFVNGQCQARENYRPILQQKCQQYLQNQNQSYPQSLLDEYRQYLCAQDQEHKQYLDKQQLPQLQAIRDNGQRNLWPQNQQYLNAQCQQYYDYLYAQYNQKYYQYLQERLDEECTKYLNAQYQEYQQRQQQLNNNQFPQQQQPINNNQFPQQKQPPQQLNNNQFPQQQQPINNNQFAQQQQPPQQLNNNQFPQQQQPPQQLNNNQFAQQQQPPQQLNNNQFPQQQQPINNNQFPQQQQKPQNIPLQQANNGIGFVPLDQSQQPQQPYQQQQFVNQGAALNNMGNGNFNQQPQQLNNNQFPQQQQPPQQWQPLPGDPPPQLQTKQPSNPPKLIKGTATRIRMKDADGNMKPFMEYRDKDGNVTATVQGDGLNVPNYTYDGRWGDIK